MFGAVLCYQWFYKSFFSVIYFLSAVGTGIQAVQLTSNHNTLKRHARMCPMKACANLPHPIFFNPRPAGGAQRAPPVVFRK